MATLSPSIPWFATRGCRAWPLTGILLLYPLWWALGLGVLIFSAGRRADGGYADPASGRRAPAARCPRFTWWLLFLVAVVVGGSARSAPTRPARSPSTAASRLDWRTSSGSSGTSR